MDRKLMMANGNKDPIKVLLWGWMGEYNRGINRLHRLEEENIIQIMGITGQQIPPWKKLDGYPVIEPESAVNEDYDYIIILAGAHEKEAIDSCRKIGGMGLDRIIPGRLFDLFDFDFLRYLRLRKEGLSVFSNDCWSGFLCQNLAIEQQSPTKNMFMTEADYLRFLPNLTYYLTECEPVFDRWNEGGYEGQPFYPVLRLGDIYLYCNHSDNPEEEINKWQRRKKRVNPSNMLFEFATADPLYMQEFLDLNLPGRKLCLTTIETKHPDAIQILPLPGISWRDTVNGVAQSFFPHLSVLDLALGDRPYIRFLT